MTSSDPLDADGYPTNETLERITKWPWEDIPALFTFVRSIWWYDGWGHGEMLSECELKLVHDEFHPGSKYVRFATGGWSGNEDIIRALRENMLVWSFTWCLSARGGLHIFRVGQDSDAA